MAQAAKALRLLVSLPEAAVAVAWEALPAQGKVQLQDGATRALRMWHGLLLLRLRRRCFWSSIAGAQAISWPGAFRPLS